MIREGDGKMSNYTVGGNSEGFIALDKELRSSYVDSVEEQLEQLRTNTVNTLSAVWSGASYEEYIKDFNAAIEIVKKDIEAEYGDVQAKLVDLSNSIVQFDQDLYKSSLS